MPPHDLPLTVLGAGLLWFGWFGFNAGSALASGGLATMAFVTTHAAAVSATLTWTLVEWVHRGKPTMFGAATGAIAGLATITPAAGFVSPLSALFIGIVAALLCYTALNAKTRFGYDDSLDAFGVHGVGGTAGTIMAGVFASVAINAAGANGLLFGNARTACDPGGSGPAGRSLFLRGQHGPVQGARMDHGGAGVARTRKRKGWTSVSMARAGIRHNANGPQREKRRCDLRFPGLPCVKCWSCSGFRSLHQIDADRISMPPRTCTTVILSPQEQGGEDNGDERHQIMVYDGAHDTHPFHTLVPQGEGHAAREEGRKTEGSPGTEPDRVSRADDDVRGPMGRSIRVPAAML